jgi:Fe2+ transport system protein FeoA
MKEISLTSLQEGEEAAIVSIVGGHAASKRLADLGLTPGTQIKVLRNALFGGPIELELRGSKLVLGRGIAAKVLVSTK